MDLEGVVRDIELSNTCIIRFVQLPWSNNFIFQNLDMSPFSDSET